VGTSGQELKWNARRVRQDERVPRPHVQAGARFTIDYSSTTKVRHFLKIMDLSFNMKGLVCYLLVEYIPYDATSCIPEDASPSARKTCTCSIDGIYAPEASTLLKLYFPLRLLAFNRLASCTESESEPLEGCRARLR